MVETGIEILQFIRSTCYLDAAQVTVPAVFCFLSCPVEVPVSQFFLHILMGTVYTDCGDSDFHQQLFVRFHVEAHDQAFSFFRLFHRQIDGVGHRFIEFHDKIQILVYPYTATYVSGQCLSIFPVDFTGFDMRFVLLGIPYQAVL